jgi:pimeloyl-ACP methyl ester carboxylesterase
MRPPCGGAAAARRRTALLLVLFVSAASCAAAADGVTEERLLTFRPPAGDYSDSQESESGPETSVRALVVTPAPGAARADAPPVLLLHGASFDADTWATLGTLKALAAAGYTAAAVDLPSATANAQRSGRHAQRAAFMDALATSLGWPRMHLVAPSASGRYALPFILKVRAWHALRTRSHAGANARVVLHFARCCSHRGPRVCGGVARSTRSAWPALCPSQRWASRAARAR